MNSKCCVILGYFFWFLWIIVRVVIMNYFECDSCIGIIGFVVDEYIFIEAYNKDF